MHNRLKQFLAAENVTQAQFASTIGIGKANISHVLSGRNKPGYDFIKAIMVGYPHLNINWLLLGTGKMYDMSLPHIERPTPDGTILFETDDLPLFEEEEVADEFAETLLEKEISGPHEDSSVDFAALTSIKESSSMLQTPAKQRKVSKIIVLFDDGSFQEM